MSETEDQKRVKHDGRSSEMVEEKWRRWAVICDLRRLIAAECTTCDHVWQHREGDEGECDPGEVWSESLCPREMQCDAVTRVTYIVTDRP